MSHLKAVASFAKQALKSEFMTPAGVVNAIFVFAAFVLVLAAGLGDLVQPIVRTWNSTYESGGASIYWLLLEYGLLSLACVLILGFLRR